MNKIKLASIVMSGVLTLVLAPALFAKNDKNPAPAPTFVVKDVNGNQIGDVIDIRDFRTVLLAVTINGKLVMLEVDRANSGFGPSTINSPHGPGSDRVYFETSDCTGTAWIENSDEAGHIMFNNPESGNFGPFEIAHSVGNQNSTAPNPLYVVSDTVSETKTLQDYLDHNGPPCRVSEKEDVQFFPAEILDLDLYNTFPTPYSVEIH